MISPFDEFSRSFDSIPVDKKPGAAEHLLAFGEATGEFDDVNGPGYTLIDDAGGRFVIERDTGIISLVHDDLLATDAGLVFPVKFRCVEFSGASYDMELKLKINGHVPQIVGDDGDFDLTPMSDDICVAETPAEHVAHIQFAPPAETAPVAIEPTPVIEPVIEVARTIEEAEIEPIIQLAPTPEPVKRKMVVAAWDGFAAFRGHGARRPLRKQGPWGALLMQSLPPVNVEAGELGLKEELPKPAPLTMSWTL